MEFKQYLKELDPPNPRSSVRVYTDDIKNISSAGVPKQNVVSLEILGQTYFYILKEGSAILWVQDKDGNPTSPSCFVFRGDKKAEPKKVKEEMSDAEREGRDGLHRQLIQLGDMMGDGLHHEEPWISKEYSKVSKLLYPEWFSKRKSKPTQAIISTLTKCPCGNGKWRFKVYPPDEVEIYCAGDDCDNTSGRCPSNKVARDRWNDNFDTLPLKEEVSMSKILQTLCDRYRVMAEKLDGGIVIMMINALEENKDLWSYDKSNRWLGFIQCYLVLNDRTTVDAERNFTRPMFHEYYRYMGIKIPESTDIK